ncbi:MAG: hypothetical protein VKK42_27150 [Lyngbya sp.]|nr:hypothetical protein [Lyngbya sp.]
MIQQSRRICYLYCYPSKLSNVRSGLGSVLAEMAIAISVPLIYIGSDNLYGYFLKLPQFHLNQQ